MGEQGGGRVAEGLLGLRGGRERRKHGEGMGDVCVCVCV